MNIPFPMFKYTRDLPNKIKILAYNNYTHALKDLCL